MEVLGGSGGIPGFETSVIGDEVLKGTGALVCCEVSVIEIKGFVGVNIGSGKVVTGGTVGIADGSVVEKGVSGPLYVSADGGSTIPRSVFTTTQLSHHGAPNSFTMVGIASRGKQRYEGPSPTG